MIQVENPFSIFFNKLTENCVQIVLSGSKKRSLVDKVNVRPIRSKKSGFVFQMTSQVGAKVFHENYDREEMAKELARLIAEEFRQCQIICEEETLTILSNKKGECSLQIKKIKTKRNPNNLSHNRVKRYILEEGTPVPFLIDLGVIAQDGTLIKTKRDKFRQINRFLEFIRDILGELPRDREVRIVDFGCGKSYLTFAIYYYLNVLSGYDIQIVGLDLKEDVIETCGELAKKYGYEKLHFLLGDIASYEGMDQVDMVVTLHACDTATDHALAKAVKWGARVILSVPCCQHEINQQIQNELLAPILSYGILKERFSALLTDGLRAEYLETMGYQTQLLEFIDMEHTPKNILIRAVYRGRKRKEGGERIHDIERAFHIEPTLKKLLS